MHLAEARRTLGGEIPWLCDSMNNDVKHALGNAPNSEFIIAPNGRIARKRLWCDPNRLRKDLIELVGPVARVTTVADLNLRTAPPPKVAASGVVKRLSRSREMKALKVEPRSTKDAQPFYAKLRVEADDDLRTRGKGRMYLGFHLDPLYHVHWNNLTEPIHVKLSAPSGVTLSKTTLRGPKPSEPADIDPREFLIDVVTGGKPGPIEVEVRYFACNDEQGWCKPVKQEYTISFTEDPDAGWVMSGRRRGREGRGNRRPGGRRRRSNQ